MFTILRSLASFRYADWRDGTFLVNHYTRQIDRWRQKLLKADDKLHEAKAQSRLRVFEAECAYLKTKQREGERLAQLTAHSDRAQRMAIKLAELTGVA